MKRNIPLILGVCAAVVTGFPLLAQDSAYPQTERTEHSRPGSFPGHRSDRLNTATKASAFIGMTVKNYKGDKLGKVKELAVDLESGRIVQVILSAGGWIGNVGKYVTAVPPGAFHYDAANQVLHLQSDKAQLKAAPKFDEAKWSEYSGQGHLDEVYRYYGEESSLGFIQTEDTVWDDRRQPDRSSGTVSTRNADGTWNHDRKESQYLLPAVRLAHLQKTRQLTGLSVYNLQPKKVGEVEDLLVDLSSGRILAVIVSSGGFLGLGNELSAIPPTALSFAADWQSLKLDATKEMLAAAPHFSAERWPDFNEPGYADRIYRAYQVEPYFTASASSADNTARNARDRDRRTLTPLDQGNSQADVATTAEIRKQIIGGENLSVNAHNVKIITRDGQVTLRGPVNTAEEKRLIGIIANNVAQLENVDNQLEVK